MYEINEEGGQGREKNPFKPHECVRCAKTFPSVHQLAQHTRVHTGEKPFKCSFCEKRFKQLSHVKQHTRLHTGERPYKCSEPACGRSFIQLSNLQQHMSTHGKDPGGKVRGISCHCSVCGKGFTTDSSLFLHMERKHKDLEVPNRQSGGVTTVAATVRPKPHICVVCSKSYTTQSALHIHSEKHKSPGSNESSPSSSSRSTNVESSESQGFRCVYCPETFISASGLAEHIKNTHSSKALPYPPPSLHHFYPPSSHQIWLDQHMHQGLPYPAASDRSVSPDVHRKSQ